MSRALFRDREHAGRLLGERLAAYAGRRDVLVLALPRGGVPVGLEVARSLGAPLDIVVVRKLGVPFEPELAMGAIASGGAAVLNEQVVDMLGLTSEAIEEVAARERLELQRREAAYRGARPPLDVSGKIVILVDDGVATGSTIRAAARALRELRPARLVIAVPVGALRTCADLRGYADEVVCLATPEPLLAISPFYQSFPQTTDDEVCRLLAEVAGIAEVGTPASGPRANEG